MGWLATLRETNRLKYFCPRGTESLVRVARTRSAKRGVPPPPPTAGLAVYSLHIVLTTSAVSSTDLGLILIFASCVIHRLPVFSW